MRADGIGNGVPSGGQGTFFNQSMVDAVLRPVVTPDQVGGTASPPDPSLSRPTSFLPQGSPWGAPAPAAVPSQPFAQAVAAPMASITSSPREFLDSLPPNAPWSRGQAPADRMRALSRSLNDLQTATVGVMHKEGRTEEDITQAMTHLQTFQQALAESPVQFPAATGINFDGGLTAAMFDSASTYNQGQSDVESAHSSAVSALQDVSKLVDHALRTPGSSAQQTTGGGWLVHAKPVDDVVGQKFGAVSGALATLMQESARIQSQGNTIVNEGDMGILGPTLKTTRREGDAPSLTDYLPGVAAGADALFKIFGDR